MCTGCTACMNICPQGCIHMAANKEGFLYPMIDYSACVKCGLCERICPINHAVEKKEVQGGYVVRLRNHDVVQKSTSGGTSAAFGKYVLDRNGVFFGVGYSEKYEVQHFMIDTNNREKLSDIRGSKYVQSDLKDTFKNVRSCLKNNQLVCFTGTPCQVAGLKSYLRKDYSNLITVDLVCHGVASPKFFKAYVENQIKHYNSFPIYIAFRNKTYGYHSGTMMIEFQNGKRYYGSGRVDPMLKAYFSGSCSRNCCYACKFKGMARCSDFTIFDSWHVEELLKDIKDDDLGYTNVYVHTEKAKKILNEMSDSISIMSADPEAMKRLDGVMIDHQPEKNGCRDELLKQAFEDDFEKAINNYLPISIKDRALEKIKAAAYKTGFLKIWQKRKR